jgi:acyl carrier protein
MNQDTRLPGTTPGEDEIRDWLIDKVATMARIARSEVDTTASFVDFGLDSRQGVGLSGDLEKWLGRKLEPTLVWDHPSISALVTHLTMRS